MTPTIGWSVVKGYAATFGRAAEIFRNNVDLPAFGYPTNPASAIVRSSSRKYPSSPSSPSVYWRGARLRELLKCTLPFPPPPPRQSPNSSPSRVRSTIGIGDRQLPIANCSELDVGRWTLDVGRLSSSACHTIVPTGTFTILFAPARPVIFFPFPCPPFCALMIGS